MIVLDNTTRSLEIDLQSAVTTNQLPFVASYVDFAAGTFDMTGAASNPGQTNSTTAVTLIAAPGANTRRQLKYLSVRNADTVSTQLWIQLNDNGTLREIWKGTLAVDDTLVYLDGQGFYVLNSSGQIKVPTTAQGIATIGSSTDNALVRWDGTGGTNVQNSGWTLSDTNVLTAGGNISLGANYISRTGTAAGLSLDASNNATLSGNLTLTGATLSTGSTTALSLATSGGTQAVFINVATAVNYLQNRGGAAGAYPGIAGRGTDSDVGLSFDTQGAGYFSFTTNSLASEQLRITHTASANRYITMTGSNGGRPVIGVSGGSLAIDNSASNLEALAITHTHATTPLGVNILFLNGAPDNNTQWALAFTDSAATRCLIYADGDVANHDGTYGTISDMRFKVGEGIAPPTAARSQVDDVKRLSRAMINYETQFSPGKRLLGFDSDQVAAISPGVVHTCKWNDVEDAKFIDTMTICVKGFKALGEVIERLEAVEARLPQ